eukprot:m.35503 g.35503  ORF g.35503 m.35503 type:complete len:466 (+) comp32134_c0_seq2:57-1454(+)
MGERKTEITLEVTLGDKTGRLPFYCHQGKTTFGSLLDTNEKEIQALSQFRSLRDDITTEIARIQRKECGSLFTKDHIIPSNGTYCIRLKLLRTRKEKQEAIETKTWTRWPKGESGRSTTSIEDDYLHVNDGKYTDKRKRIVETDSAEPQDISIKTGPIEVDGGEVNLASETFVIAGSKNSKRPRLDHNSKTADLFLKELEADMPDPEQLETYKRRLKSGTALVIDIPRPGSDTDVQRLEKCFHDNLKFELECKSNLTVEEINNEISKFLKKNFSDSTCSLVIIMAHGKNNAFYGKDQKPVDGKQPVVDISEMLKKFEDVESLNGKPKLFLFQCCRGSTSAPLVEGDDPHHRPPSVESDDPHPATCPSSSDFFVGYATGPGYKSFRQVDKSYPDEIGSWYIQALVTAIEKYVPHGWDIGQIHTVVNNVVAKKQGSENAQLVGQGAQYQSTLRSPFYLQERKKSGWY